MTGYELVRLPPDDRGRQLWAVRNTATGTFVENNGERETFAIRDTARGWIQRQRYIEGHIGA
ncbi:hypothetical protein [Kitasatospora sp. HPMI-4]|uniref:hypothetical protein n=1 Tax=Kitasatospora sp. HPMI-4 TaxID=3448443 RepID=UPI003F1A3F7A